MPALVTPQMKTNVFLLQGQWGFSFTPAGLPQRGLVVHHLSCGVNMVRRKKSVGSGHSGDKVGMPRSAVNVSQVSRRRNLSKPFKFSNYIFKVLKQVHPQVRVP